MNRLVSTLGIAFVGLAAACAGTDSAAPVAYETVVEAPGPVVVAEPPRLELQQAPVELPQEPGIAPAPPAASGTAPKAVPPPAKSPAKAATPTVAVEMPRPVADPVAGPVAVAKASEPALDVAGLTARLRDTSGIGVFAKLALKNQVDDLLKRFRTHYQSGQKTGVAALRQPYDMLVLKVLALLQDSDPALARTISGSREAIWGILADREKFNAIALLEEWLRDHA
jgi:hypothetical protein